MMKEVHYFYIPNIRESAALPEEEAKHATRVLRLQEGDMIYAMDGVGNFYGAELAVATPKRCLLTNIVTIPQRKEWEGHVHLAIAPTKNMDRIEWLVEKATEIGFDELSFLQCDFSERKVVRVDRIEKIVVSAIKQSRKSTMPLVNDLQPFMAFVEIPRKGGLYIAHCYEEVLRHDFYTQIGRLSAEEDITVLIGPEGDFSIGEVELAIKQGYQSVSLGTSRLRTETAGLSAVMMSQLIKRKIEAK